MRFNCDGGYRFDAGRVGRREFSEPLAPEPLMSRVCALAENRRRCKSKPRTITGKEMAIRGSLRRPNTHLALALGLQTA